MEKKKSLKKLSQIEQEKIKKEILEFKETFSKNFDRVYNEDNFFSNNSREHLAGFLELEKIWKIKADEPKKINIINSEKLLEINNQIYIYYNYLLESFNYNSSNRTEFDSIIKEIIFILCNIYDLFPNFLEIFFKNEWLNLHLRLIDACLDINDPPEPSLGSSGKEKITTLSYFLTLFCLCMSNDKDMNNRIYLIVKYPDLFYKITIIACNTISSCCCGHGMDYSMNSAGSSIKSILLVFETFKYMEENKIVFDSAKKAKIQILEFLFKNIGKNICIVYLYKMTKMLNKDEIFNHILNKTNLFMEAIAKECNECFGHAIDGFEEFIKLCNIPKHLFKMLIIISPPEKGLKSRIYREILKSITNIISENQIDYLEKKLYNSEIFQEALDTLNQDIYLGEYEGIWEILLNSSNNNIVKIFYKNKYEVGDILTNQINNLVENNFTGMRLNVVIRIMNLFLKVGNEVKKKFNTNNYYLEQFRDAYKKISWPSATAAMKSSKAAG